MKVTIEDSSSTEKKINVSIPAETVRLEREGIVRDLMRNAKVDGFRQGKVPEAEINRLFGDKIKQELLSNLITNSFPDALKEVSAEPVSRPSITPGVIDGDNEFSYSAVFDVLPAFELPQYKGLALKQSPVSVAPADVEAAMKQITENAATVEPVSEARPCAAGDVVEVDYKGTVEGETIEGLENKSVRFLLGNGSLVENFEKNITGMSAGEEKEFEVAYPEDFQIKEAAGKSVLFNLKVNTVFDRTVPELNDEFAKKIGAENIAELKNNIEKDMTARLENLRDRSLEEQICSQLGEAAKFEIPERMAAEEKSRLESELKKDFEARGGKEFKIDEKMAETLANKARENVKLSLIVNKIAETESIEATQKDLDERFSSIAAGAGATPEQVREYYEKNRLLNGLNSQVVSAKVLEFIRDNSTITTEEPAKSD
ncbi:MAG: trigger factor [Candidatus Dadabacteria bacterium]|nr:trigger factor [Candidatus Dadabacteria bacterium]